MTRDGSSFCPKAAGPVPMSLRTMAVLLSLGLGLMLQAARGEEAESLLVEVESFPERGGWVVDQQFIDVMGSSYLLAHGLGKPCSNAKATVEFPADGNYRVWVRTKDWVAEPEWAPGQFRVLINDEPLDETFGTKGDGKWIWQDGGTVEIGGQKVSIELDDLTGFDGRCDAILFTTDPNAKPPQQAGEAMRFQANGTKQLRSQHRSPISCSLRSTI
ncbi:MAG: hypothetical protein H8E44_25200 [Planctomycetes bacterium]|nr:hypothetical protein [Planctomycetota bacterium]MBL7042351.1 hypothetical protein [Pirellulaceae bacterium]